MKTFKDLETGLEWLLEDFGPMPWEEAMALDVEGFRLPTKGQLLTLTDDSTANPACSKPIDILSGGYWTSTSYVLSTASAWYVVFYNGNVNYNYKTNDYYVRLVRTIKDAK